MEPSILHCLRTRLVEIVVSAKRASQVFDGLAEECGASLKSTDMVIISPGPLESGVVCAPADLGHWLQCLVMDRW